MGNWAVVDISFYDISDERFQQVVHDLEEGGWFPAIVPIPDNIRGASNAERDRWLFDHWGCPHARYEYADIKTHSLHMETRGGAPLPWFEALVRKYRYHMRMHWWLDSDYGRECWVEYDCNDGSASSGIFEPDMAFDLNQERLWEHMDQFAYVGAFA